MPRRTLGRDQLSQFLPNHEAIKAFEGVLDDVSTGLPNLINDAANAADSAGAAAHAAVALLAQIAGALDALLMAPASQPPTYADDFTPVTLVGTLAAQDYDHVDITGGTVGLDSGTVGAPSLYLNGEKTTGLYRIGVDHWGLSIAGTKLMDYSAGVLGVAGVLGLASGAIGATALYLNGETTTGLYRIGADHWGMSVAGDLLLDMSLNLLAISGNATAGDFTASGQLKSTVAVGTPPLSVVSTTKVDNLYVARAALADVATIANGLSSPSTFPADATDLPTVIALANALKAACSSKGV